MKNKHILPAIALATAIAASATHAGVVAHYTFDTDYTDSSGNGNHGTLNDVGTQGNSGITTTTVKFGAGAMDFSTERDYIGVAEQEFGATVAFSVSFWAKKNVPSTKWMMVMGVYNQAENYIAINNDLKIRDGDNDYSSTYPVTNDTAWHHYVVSVSSDHTVTGYFDGVAQTVATPTGLAGKSFIYDAIGDGFTSDNNDFTGQLDEMWIFNEAIDQATVTSLFNANVIPEPSAIVAQLGLVGAGLLFRRRR